MAEKIISPGVFTNEIDQTFLPSAVADIGAALIGPTLKGPAGIPTIVTSFSDFQAKFGDVFKSGSDSVQFLTSHAAEEYLKNSSTLTVVRIMADGGGAVGPAEATITSSVSGVDAYVSSSFTLETLGDGTIMNNFQTAASTNSVLTNGSKHNIRYEITSKNDKKGTFSLSIRAGNDNEKRKQALETYNNLTLDPNSPNYISKVIGDQKQNVKDDNGTKYIELSGSYANKSRFVRVKSVITPTIDYLDENGVISNDAYSASLPAVGSGSSLGGFDGGTDGHSGFNGAGVQGGDIGQAVNFYENITETNSQGFNPTVAADGLDSYIQALDLLANQDEFDINLILMPGIIDSLHTSVASKAIDVCESRGDCFTVIDPVPFNSTLAQATARGDERDSNFAAMYWPWVKVPDSQLAGAQRWVPPSVVMGGIYAFNDRVAHP